MVDPTSNKSIWSYHHKNKLFLDTHCFCIQKWRLCTKRLKTNFCELTDVVKWWICMSRWKRLAGNGNACDEYIHLGWLLRGANQPTSKILTGQPPPPANQPAMASLSRHRQLKKPICECDVKLSPQMNARLPLPLPSPLGLAWLLPLPLPLSMHVSALLLSMGSWPAHPSPCEATNERERLRVSLSLCP